VCGFIGSRPEGIVGEEYVAVRRDLDAKDLGPFPDSGSMVSECGDGVFIDGKLAVLVSLLIRRLDLADLLTILESVLGCSADMQDSPSMSDQCKPQSSPRRIPVRAASRIAAARTG
jgi:hypothetical protein